VVEELVSYLKNPHWGRQHRWRKAIWTTMARVGLTGVHGLPVNRRWIDIHRRNMPFKDLDPTMAGFKLVQISDLHYSPVVWKRYLIQFIDWINELEPDMVVVTGDLITGGYRYADRVAGILAHLKAPHGIICTFGNHDYSVYGKGLSAEGKRRADYLQRSLLSRGLIVLRNEVHYIKPAGATTPLAIIGLDDEWSGHIDAAAAFAGVDPALPAICLNHIPVNCNELMDHSWQWMLSGHTHGRQVATSALGRRLYPHRYRHFTHGYYSVNGRHLYVNRGLSYGQRILDWCRPEVTVFKLERSEPA
jgi:predicted MPP superfamily phosphohydrolase